MRVPDLLPKPFQQAHEEPRWSAVIAAVCLGFALAIGFIAFYARG